MSVVHIIGRQGGWIVCRLRGAVRLLSATALFAALCLLAAEPRAAGALLRSLVNHLIARAYSTGL